MVLIDLIWKVSEYIRNFQTIEFKYKRQDGKEFNRIVKPVSVMFSEFYFYLIAFFADDLKDFPAVFRLDRCSEIKATGEVFEVPEKLHFQDGLFRKRVQFMYPGELMTIEFKFWGSSLEAVLDRLPTAEVVDHDNEGRPIVKAQVYGEGIIMLLLNQMEFVEIIRPEKLRKGIKVTINKFAEIYK